MTNAELIAALRICGNYADRDGCDEACPYYNDNDCPKRIMCDAADALEAADKRIDGLQKLVDINTERCETLRKQLREAHESYEKHINELTTKCNQLQAAVDNYEKRIAELEAQEPTEKQVVDYCHKRCLVIVEEELFQRMKATFSRLPKEGEWLRTDAFPHRIYCSVCYKTYVPNDRWQIWVDDELPKNYCPNCGAKMRGEHDEH